MRTILAIIGVVALLIVAVIAAAVFTTFGRMKPLAKEAVAYVDEAIPAVATAWDGEALYARAAPEFQDVLIPQTLAELMEAGVSQFGPMTDYRGAQCGITRVAFNTGKPEEATAECVADASFARIDGRLTVAALKRGGEWKLFGFTVVAAGEPALPSAHVLLERKLTVFEASFKDGYVAASARARPLAGAEIGDVRAVHIEPQQ